MPDFNSSLPVRTEANGDIVTKLVDFTTNTQGLAVSVAGEASVKVKNAAADPAAVEVIVAGSAIDPRQIRTLTTSDEIKVDIQDSSGTPFSVSNPLPVSLVDAVSGSTEVLDYKTATVASAGNDTHTYTVTGGKTLKLQKIVASSSGKIKVEIKLGTISSEVTKVVLFNSTASPNCEYEFKSPQSIPDTDDVLVIITNLDKQSEDVYSTIEGYEV